MRRSLSVIMYRMWYTHVMNFFEEVRRIEWSSCCVLCGNICGLGFGVVVRTQRERLFGQLHRAVLEVTVKVAHTLHNTINSVALNSYRSANSPDKRRQLRDMCLELETTMSSQTIQFARALSLGWRENEDFYECFKIQRKAPTGQDSSAVDFMEVGLTYVRDVSSILLVLRRMHWAFFRLLAPSSRKSF